MSLFRALVVCEAENTVLIRPFNTLVFDVHGVGVLMIRRSLGWINHPVTRNVTRIEVKVDLVSWSIQCDRCERQWSRLPEERGLQHGELPTYICSCL